MWRIGIVLLVLGVAENGYSNPPPPTPTETRQNPQSSTTQPEHRTEQDQQGTVESPLIIKLLPSLDTEIKPKGPEQQHNEKPANNWWTDSEFLLVIVTVLLWMTTGVLAAYTAFLWGSTKTSSEHQLRAYVYVDDVQISLGQGTDNVIVRIKNFGQTPAYNLSCMTAITFEVSDVRPPLERFEEMFPSRADIAPTGTFRRFLRNDFGEESRKTMKDGEKTLFLFGIIRYRDAFDGDRETEFRYIYRSERSLAEGQWEHTRNGNHST